jgi:hypothetical protein
MTSSQSESTEPAGAVLDALHCANPRCGRALGVDHVTMVTTTHVRRFCTVECITEGQQCAMEAARVEDVHCACGDRYPSYVFDHCPFCGAKR